MYSYYASRFLEATLRTFRDKIEQKLTPDRRKIKKDATSLFNSHQAIRFPVVCFLFFGERGLFPALSIVNK